MRRLPGRDPPARVGRHQVRPHRCLPEGPTVVVPGTNGHADKCSPQDTVCNNSPSGAVNCRKP